MAYIVYICLYVLLIYSKLLMKFSNHLRICLLLFGSVVLNPSENSLRWTSYDIREGKGPQVLLIIFNVKTFHDLWWKIARLRKVGKIRNCWKISFCGNVCKHFMMLIIVPTPFGTFPLQSTEIERHHLNFGLFLKFNFGK